MAKESFLFRFKRRLFGSYEWIVDFTDQIPKYDVKKCRISSMLGYLCFFIPMTMHDDRQFARFHCNQGIVLALAEVILSFAVRIFGRLQSRIYTKLTEDGPIERTAYEISALSAQILEAEDIT